jgi:CRP/FNR family cyclic AMP-dependent transcriptional regulator
MATPSAPSDRRPLELADHLRCTTLSGLLRGKLCEQLQARPARRLATGRVLYVRGDAARSVFLVRSGLVKTSMVSEGGEELTLRVCPPGEIIGELCWCSGERREQAVALEPSEVVEIPLADLIAQLKRSPEAMADFIVAACDQLADAYDKLESRSFESTAARLVRTLIRLARDLGEQTASGISIPHYIKQEELAHLIGARREVVSTWLNRLRARRLLSYTRKGRITMDVSGLAAYLQTLSRARTAVRTRVSHHGLAHRGVTGALRDLPGASSDTPPGPPAAARRGPG